MKKVDIGIIGALEDEVRLLVTRLENHEETVHGGIKFHTGTLFGKKIAIARCGVGKVFAAMCAEAMIMTYAPSLIVNTGVGGALRAGLAPTDIVAAERLVQHDMDTSPLGDPKGLISGINKVYFDSDSRALEILADAAHTLGYNFSLGTVASGDKFISTREEKLRILSEFSASVCEMEGAAIAHVAYVNATPFVVIRAISDSADDSSSMDYLKFLPIAAKRSSELTLALCKAY